MFNLEQAIIEWRKQMTDAGIQSPVPLEELENHLRDDIERQMHSGADGDRAFAVAMKRIGSGEMLQREFARVGLAAATRERKWALVAVVVTLTVYAFMLVSAAVTASFTADQRFLVLAAGALTIAAVLGGRFGHRIFPVISNKRKRLAVEAACAVPIAIGVAVFMNVFLIELSSSVERVVLLTLWGMVPLAVLAGFIFGMEEAVYQRRVKQSS